MSLATAGAGTAPRMTRRSFVEGAVALGAVWAGGSLLGCSPAADGRDDDAHAGASDASGVSDGDAQGSPDAASPLTAGTAAVVYFSMPLTEADDLDAPSGASVVVRDDGSMVGNVEYVADYIAEQTGADLIRIEAQVDYPDTPDELIDYALDEQDRGERPDIELVAADGSAVTSLDAYDTLFVGSLHLGMQWTRVMARVRRRLGAYTAPAGVRAVLRLVALALAAWGAYELVELGLLDYITLRTRFAFIDTSRPLVPYLLPYAAVMCLCVCAGHCLCVLLARLCGRGGARR